MMMMTTMPTADRETARETTIYHLLRYHIAAYLPLSWRLEVREVCRAFNDSIKDVRTGIHRPKDVSRDVWKMWMADMRKDYDRTFLPVTATRQSDSQAHQQSDSSSWVVTYTILDPRWCGFPMWAKKDYCEATPWLGNSWIRARADDDKSAVTLSVDDARKALACMAVPRKSKRKATEESPKVILSDGKVALSDGKVIPLNSLPFHHRDAGKMNAYDATGRPRYMVYHQLRDADCHFDMRRSVDAASARGVIDLLRHADTDRYRAKYIVAPTDADFLIDYKDGREGRSLDYTRSFFPAQYTPSGYINVSRGGGGGGSSHGKEYKEYKDLPGTEHPITFTIAYDGIPFDVCNGHVCISRNPPKALAVYTSYEVRQPVVLVSLPRWSDGEGRGDSVSIDNVACFVNPRDRMVSIV